MGLAENFCHGNGFVIFWGHSDKSAYRRALRYDLLMKTLIRVAVVVGVLLAASAVAQVNGVPASVTSIGTLGRGMTPGVPASVTSLGPNGWNVPCCIVPTRPLPLIPSAMGFRDPRFNRDGRAHFLPGSGPFFVPFPVGYPVPYPVPVMPEYVEDQTTQQPEPEPEGNYPPATIFDRRPTRTPQAAAQAVERQPDSIKPVVETAPHPERPQEPTLVIFKDGKKIEVLNFAIVGDTLYELSPEYRKIPLADLDVPATVKANDDRGLEFHVPKHKGS